MPTTIKLREQLVPLCDPLPFTTRAHYIESRQEPAFPHLVATAALRQFKTEPHKILLSHSPAALVHLLNGLEKLIAGGGCGCPKKKRDAGQHDDGCLIPDIRELITQADTVDVPVRFKEQIEPPVVPAPEPEPTAPVPTGGPIGEPPTAPKVPEPNMTPPTAGFTPGFDPFENGKPKQL